MIDESVLIGLVQECGSALASKHSEHATEIAMRSAEVTLRLRALLPELQGTEWPSLCFELCAPLDELLKTDDAALRQSIGEIRSRAQETLLRKHYDNRRRTEQGNMLAINREEAIATIVATAVKKFRESRPKKFGPEWFRFELGDAAYDDLREFAYDLEGDSVQWTLIRAMMPSEMSRAFDPREFGEMPTIIETDEQFREVLEILERRGYPLTELLDAGNAAKHLREVPGFQTILEYAERLQKATSPVSAISRSAPEGAANRR